MKEKIEARLADLRTEFETGQRMLADLDEEREKLRESMLRIAGAVQVLEEVVGAGEREDGNEKEEDHVHTGEQP